MEICFINDFFIFDKMIFNVTHDHVSI
jgi:hypothetical protein